LTAWILQIQEKKEGFVERVLFFSLSQQEIHRESGRKSKQMKRGRKEKRRRNERDTVSSRGGVGLTPPRTSWKRP